jgi:hypothetical protein
MECPKMQKASRLSDEDDTGRSNLQGWKAEKTDKKTAPRSVVRLAVARRKEGAEGQRRDSAACWDLRI